MGILAVLMVAKGVQGWFGVPHVVSGEVAMFLWWDNTSRAASLFTAHHKALLGVVCISFETCPIVRYTGQGCLLPPKLVRCVLSEARMSGVIMAPKGSQSLCLHINIWLKIKQMKSLLPALTTTSHWSTSHQKLLSALLHPHRHPLGWMTLAPRMQDCQSAPAHTQQGHAARTPALPPWVC